MPNILCILFADGDDGREKFFLETISQFVDKIDIKFVLIANKIDSKTSIDDLIQFSLKGLSHKWHRVRTSCAMILKKLVPGLLERDIELMNKRVDLESPAVNKNGNSSNQNIGDAWHLLGKFNQALVKSTEWATPYIEEFK